MHERMNKRKKVIKCILGFVCGFRCCRVSLRTKRGLLNEINEYGALPTIIGTHSNDE